MPAIVSHTPATKVLVTGANGFVGLWVVRYFLEAGYTVRAAVRNEERGQHLKDMFASKFGTALEFCYVGELTADGTFDEAVKNVDGIIHVASPLSSGQVEPSEYIEPAVKGAMGMLNSAHRYGNTLKRIIFTGSCTTIQPFSTEIQTVNEEVWNDFSVRECEEKGSGASPIHKYSASKVLAEKAIWNWFNAHKSALSWDITVLHPPYIFGPILYEAQSPSDLRTCPLYCYQAVMEGDVPHQPLNTTPGHSWIDVRDVAASHLRALEVEEAGGERIVTTTPGSFVWGDWVDMVDNLSNSPISQRKKLAVAGEKRRAVTLDGSKGQKILGLQYRGMEEVIRDILKDYKARGWC